MRKGRLLKGKLLTIILGALMVLSISGGGGISNAADLYVGTPPGSSGDIPYNNAGEWSSSSPLTTDGTSSVTVKANDPATIYDVSTPIDVDYWAGVVSDNDGVADTSDLYQIGKGTVPGTTPLVTVDKDGNVGIGTTGPLAKFHIADEGVILAQGTYDSGWVEPNLGMGERLLWYPRKGSFRVGRVYGDKWNDENIGIVSFASGSETTASGSYSTAMGTGSTASGDGATALGYSTTASAAAATAFGYSTTASASYSVAMGSDTTASGANSTAMGGNTTASGKYSTALSYRTTSASYADVVLGRYNIGGGTNNSWVATDALFEIGNGTATDVKRNALTVLKNGNTYMGGSQTDVVGTGSTIAVVTGNVGINTTAPQSLLDVQGDAGAAGILTLATKELTVVATDELGRINFNAPLEADGTDAILPGASIWAVAEGTFGAASNATSLVLATGASEAATGKVYIKSDGNVGIGSALAPSKFNVWGNATIGANYLSSESAAPSNGMIVQGNVGIGTVSPDCNFVISKDGGYALAKAKSYNDNTSIYPGFRFEKYGGTEASPTIIAAGSILGEFWASGWDGDSINEACKIIFKNTGTPANSRIGGEIQFWTAEAAGDWDCAQKMVIGSNGNVGINTTAPQSLLDVQGPAGTGTATPGKLTLATKETTIVSGDELGRINFNAPLEADGTDAILPGASIWAVAEDTFAADNNKTSLVFATGASGAATEKVRIDSSGNMTVAGTLTSTGTLHGPIEIIADDNSLSAAQCYGSLNNLNGAETTSLPAAVAGMNVLLYSNDATVKTIAPNGTDHIWLNGVDNGAGNSIDSPGAVGDFIVLVAMSNNNWYSLGQSGTWIDTP